MKALFFTQHGGPEVMQYGDLPDRQPVLLGLNLVPRGAFALCDY